MITLIHNIEECVWFLYSLLKRPQKPYKNLYEILRLSHPPFGRFPCLENSA